MSHISRAFRGLTIIPITGSADEYALTMRLKSYLAVGITLGRTLQITLYFAPLMVVLGWVTNKPMTFHYDKTEAIVVSLALLVVSS